MRALEPQLEAPEQRPVGPGSSGNSGDVPYSSTGATLRVPPEHPPNTR